MLHDGLETRPGSCARNVDSIKEGYACLGEELNMFGAISDDFGKTEQCNYYIFPSQISTLQYAMAFRVSYKQWMIYYKKVFILFQKNSPYIKEVNKQLQILVDMGLINKWVRESVGNATKCDTLGKMIDSKVDPLTVLNLSHVGSSFVLAMAGLMVATLAFICEFVKHKSKSNSRMSRSNQGVANPPRALTGYFTRSRPI